MTLYRFPSSDFPAFPEIALDVPDSWAPDTAPSVLMVLFDPESPSGFRTNLTVRIDRTVGGVDIGTVGSASADAMRTEPEYELQGEDAVEIDGRSALLRVHTFVPESTNGAPLFQALGLLLVPTVNPAFTDVVSIVATCLGAEADRYGALFRQIIDSTRIKSGD